MSATRSKAPRIPFIDRMPSAVCCRALAFNACGSTGAGSAGGFGNAVSFILFGKPPAWSDFSFISCSTSAVLILWDDSDGWYDHQMGPIVNTSTGAADSLTGPGACGDGTTSLPGVDPGNAHAQGRCGFGPRLPLLVVSPFAKRNFVDHTLTDQSSTVRFIEDNWLGGQRLGQGSFDSVTNSITQMFDFDRHRDDDDARRVLFLNPSTGEPVHE